MDIENEGRWLKRIDIQDKRNASHAYVFSVFKGTKEISMGRYGLHSYNHNSQKLIVSGPGGISFGITQDINGSRASNIKIVLEQELVVNTNFEVFRRYSNDIVNSLPADLSVITADGTNKANYNGAMIYATDLEGKVTKINLTDKGTLYQTTTLFTAEATSANGRYIYTRPEVTINNDNNLWLYFGTGSTQKLQAQSSQIKNRLYGIKDKNFPNFATVSSPENVSKCKTAPTCPGGTDLGWYVDLKKSQKLTAEPTVDKDRVYFPIYEPDTTSACKTGNAILTGYDSKCGNSVLNVNMGKGVLSKVVKQGDNLYIGLAGEVNTSIAGFTIINFTS
jgi:type IV pilus assembly protein PilY1